MQQSNKTDKRVVLSDVAKAADVSIMTVSYALRGNPKISGATRDRIQALADRMGYVPDPEIGRLMHLLRAGQARKQSWNMVLLIFSHLEPQSSFSYTARVCEAANRRAQQLGFDLDNVCIDITQTNPARTTQMLEARGIRGVLIPPLPEVLDCGRLLDWEKFAVVAATYSAIGCSIDRVVPHHLSNFRLLMKHLRAQGHQRIGMLVGSDLQSRFNNCHLEHYCYLRAIGDIAPLPYLADPSPSAIEEWVKAHHPTVIVSGIGQEGVVEACRLASRLPVVLMDTTNRPDCAGIDQVPEEIGRSAVELLSAKMQRGEWGLPQNPQVTMVEGRLQSSCGCKGRSPDV